MKRQRSLHAGLATGVALCFALAGAPSHAQDLALHPQRVDGITVVNGGAGLDEAAAIKRMASQYPLKVVISRRNGEYDIADRIEVSRRGQHVTEIRDAGPWLLVDLPPGRYTLRGEFAGTVEQRDVTIGPGGASMLHWVRAHVSD